MVPNLDSVCRLSGKVEKEIIALRNDQPVYRVDWFCQVVAWEKEFSRCAEKKWALYEEDGLLFSILLFALWQAGKQVVLLKDALPGTVLSAQAYIDAMVGSAPVAGFNKTFMQSEFREVSEKTEPNYLSLDREGLALYIFTSGSTAEPEIIPLKFFQIENELRCHEQLWAEKLTHAHVYATVSHQHLYGLLFKILWPLLAGRPFVSESFGYIEDVICRAGSDHSLALITTPSHLSRLSAEISGLNTTGTWRAVFSSTAPLAKKHSQLAKNLFGVDVIEIYGSSETGGVAWRSQTREGGDAWQLLPGIKMNVDASNSSLRLCSPFVDEEKYISTSDKVEQLALNRFKLLGRIDRIAKVEGKRVSLSAMEQCLKESHWVEDARIVTDDAKRVSTWGVVLLTNAGDARLSAVGKAAFNALLKEKLMQMFERVVLPRKWRYVREFPMDSQGKVTVQKLKELF